MWLAAAIRPIALALPIWAAAMPASAQDYPARPIHLVVGFPAGSGADIGARWIGERLADGSKTTVVVENKPGAGSNIAIGLVAAARPDGYTILFAASSAMAGSRFLYKDFRIDTEDALVPAALLYRTNFVATVAPTSAVGSVDALTRALKAKARNLHAYTNQTGQIAGAYYLAKVGARSEAVSYRTAAEAVADLGSGTLDFMMLDGAFAAGQFRAGRIKPLAVTSARRSAAMPEVPSMQEAGVAGVEFAPFWAAYLPKGTAPEIVAKVTGWMIELVKLEATRAQFATTGRIAIGEGPDAARAELKLEIEKWRDAVRAAGVEPQ